MRVIFEPGDTPEVKALVKALASCGLRMVMMEEKPVRLCRPLSDAQLRTAIVSVLTLFTVSTQWVAVYRVLTDFCGFPADMSAFCQRMGQLMKGVQLTYPCRYQSIQKPLTSHAILSKHYSLWQEYKPRRRDWWFARQKKVADRLLEALGNV